MKQMIFAILLAIALIGLSILSGAYMTDECDQLLFQLSQAEQLKFHENWKAFSKVAALLTPYDLIRVTDSNVENYVALLQSDAPTADLEAAKQILCSSIQDIRRIHSVSWELIF